MLPFVYGRIGFFVKCICLNTVAFEIPVMYVHSFCAILLAPISLAALDLVPASKLNPRELEIKTKCESKLSYSIHFV